MTPREILWLVIIAAFAGYTLYERHEGARGCVQGVKTEIAEQQKSDVPIIAQEGQKYEDAILQPIPNPVVYGVMYQSACPVAPTAAVGKPDGSAPLRTASPPAPTASWSSAALEADGRDADAQIAGLQDYISRVCLTTRGKP